MPSNLSRLTRRILLSLMLLLGAVILARGPLPVAKATASPSAPPFGARSPSVVMQAFRQGQVIGAGDHKAALVIRFGDGGYQTRCVAFSEENISGDELLTRANVEPVIFGPSFEVCSISGQGCPSDDCWCQCQNPAGGNCKYWAYYHWVDGNWAYSVAGADGWVIEDGSLDGWSWGEGNFSSGVEPPRISFDEICNGAAQNTPTATPTRPTTPPEVSFQAQPANVAPGQCSTLTWLATGATTVTLDGIAVPFQGSQQVCPAAAQTWTLIAANAVGQTTRQATVQIGAGQPSGTTGAQATATFTPAATTAPASYASPTPGVAYPTQDVIRSGMPTPAYLTPQPGAIMTQAPQQGGFATPGFGDSPLPAPEPQLVGGVPLAPTAEPLAAEPQTYQGPLPTPTRFVFALPPTETPRPRRVLDEGRPTPTPILVARAGGSTNSGASASASARPSTGPSGGANTLVASRAFSPALLPQYAAYLATLLLLLAVGWLVRRRRSGEPVAVRQRAGAANVSRERGDERAAQ